MASNGGDGPCSDGDDVPRAQVERDAARFELREVVKVADDLAHAVGRPRDGVDDATGGAVVGRDRLPEEAGAHHDGRQGVLEVVTDDRDEIGLGGLFALEAGQALLDLADDFLATAVSPGSAGAAARSASAPRSAMTNGLAMVIR